MPLEILNDFGKIKVIKSKELFWCNITAPWNRHNVFYYQC